MNVTRGLADWAPLLLVFHDAADIVPVLPNDVRAISGCGDKRPSRHCYGTRKSL